MANETMVNPIDIGIVVIIGFCLLRGFFRGIIKETASIAGILCGVWIAWLYYKNVAHFIGAWISSISYLDVLSFMIIFFSVLVIANILGSIIKHFAKAIYFEKIDRVAGAVFGAAKGIIAAAFCLAALVLFLPENNSLLKSSRLSPRIFLFSGKALQKIPEDVKKKIKKKTNSLQKTWKAT